MRAYALTSIGCRRSSFCSITNAMADAGMPRDVEKMRIALGIGQHEARELRGELGLLAALRHCVDVHRAAEHAAVLAPGSVRKSPASASLCPCPAACCRTRAPSSPSVDAAPVACDPVGLLLDGLSTPPELARYGSGVATFSSCRRL